MASWLHKFLNPHCIDCQKPDPIVDELRMELANLRRERDKLLSYILDKPELPPNVNIVDPEELDPKPILPKVVPWHIRRELLESEDRNKAALMRRAKEDQAKAIEDLEKELGVVAEKEISLDLENGNVQSKSV